MSTYVSIGCKPCQEVSEGYNHTEDVAAAIIELATVVQRLWSEALPLALTHVQVEHEPYTMYVYFVRDHVEHGDLWIVNEYGHAGKTLVAYQENRQLPADGLVSPFWGP